MRYLPFRENKARMETHDDAYPGFSSTNESGSARAEDCLTSPIAVVRSKKSDVRRVEPYPEDLLPMQMPIQGSKLVIRLQSFVACLLFVFALLIIVIRSSRCLLGCKRMVVSDHSCNLPDSENLHPRIYPGTESKETDWKVASICRPHHSLGFFFFLFLGLASFARGCSKILRTSSSVIFLSVLNFVRSGAGGAASFWTPFFVMAGEKSASEGKQSRSQRTNGGQQSANWLIILISNNLILSEDISSNAFNNSNLGISLILQLS